MHCFSNYLADDRLVPVDLFHASLLDCGSSRESRIDVWLALPDFGEVSIVGSWPCGNVIFGPQVGRWCTPAPVLSRLWSRSLSPQNQRFASEGLWSQGWFLKLISASLRSMSYPDSLVGRLSPSPAPNSSWFWNDHHYLYEKPRSWNWGNYSTLAELSEAVGTEPASSSENQ